MSEPGLFPSTELSGAALSQELQVAHLPGRMEHLSQSHRRHFQPAAHFQPVSHVQDGELEYHPNRRTECMNFNCFLS